VGGAPPSPQGFPIYNICANGIRSPPTSPHEVYARKPGGSKADGSMRFQTVPQSPRIFLPQVSPHNHQLGPWGLCHFQGLCHSRRLCRLHCLLWLPTAPLPRKVKGPAKVKGTSPPTWPPTWRAVRPLRISVRPLRISVRPLRISVRPLRILVRPLRIPVRPLRISVRPLRISVRPLRISVRPLLVRSLYVAD
jgi:hypothetical protein